MLQRLKHFFGLDDDVSVSVLSLAQKGEISIALEPGNFVKTEYYIISKAKSGFSLFHKSTYLLFPKVLEKVLHVLGLRLNDKRYRPIVILALKSYSKPLSLLNIRIICEFEEVSEKNG